MDYDIIVAGAGPVGLMLANLIASQCSASILVIEQHPHRQETSRAIGITPPSLELFKHLNLSDSLILEGVKIETAAVHSGKRKIGALSFKELPEPFPYILSCPQYHTERVLEENLLRNSNVTIARGERIIGVNDSNETVSITLIETEGSKQRTVTGKYLCACDGGNSAIRDYVNVARVGSRYSDTFVMGDFVDRTNLGHEAHLYFTKEGAIESFPLPGGKRRWVVQTDGFVATPSVAVHIQKVMKRAGVHLHPNDNFWLSPFGVQHYMNKKFYKGNVFFCGDAAHTMSPIGGQGMNTGFADAEFLAAIVAGFHEKGKKDISLLKQYENCRKTAARSATVRAWSSMRVGTATGFWAPVRDFSLFLFLHSPLKKWGAPHFAMQTIPYGSLKKVIAKRPKLSSLLSTQENHPEADGK